MPAVCDSCLNKACNELQRLILHVGLQPRTQEILKTLNLLEPLYTKGNRMSEDSYWAPDASGQLARIKVGPEVTNATPFPYVLVTDQGSVETVFENNLKLRGCQIDRGMELVHYSCDKSPGIIWPVTAYVRNHVSGVIEIWYTKFLLGCDGAGSMVRHVEGIQWNFRGAHETWAVADVWAETDFPDLRRHCTIWSPHGSCMLMPNRDNGFRVYTQLGPEEVNSLNAIGLTNFSKPLFPEINSTLLFEILQAHISTTLAPFTVQITKVAWISRYSVHQGLTSHFSSQFHRVFLLGDASHTHSPYTVQGMNSGIADAYNLTWKLALVAKGHAALGILDTYGTERQYIADEIIRHDIRCRKFFPWAELDNSPDSQSLSKKIHGLMSGCEHRYLESPLVQYSVRCHIDQDAVEPLTPGKRLHTMTLTRHVDGTVVDLLEVMPSIGRFHLVLFAGNLLHHAVFQGLCNYLTSSESPLSAFVPDSPLSNPASQHREIGSVNTRDGNQYLDVYLIHSTNHLDVELGQLPRFFESSKVFEDVGGFEHAIHGVHETAGVMALVRPDGYITMVTNFDNGTGVMHCLKSFMIFAPLESSPSTLVAEDRNPQRLIQGLELPR